MVRRRALGSSVMVVLGNEFELTLDSLRPGRPVAGAECQSHNHLAECTIQLDELVKEGNGLGQRKEIKWS